MNKRAFIGDYALWAVLLFVLSLVILVIAFVVSTFNTAWTNSPNINGQAETMFSNFAGRFSGIWDFWFLLLLIGFIIAIIIIAVALRTHPVFAVFAIFIMIVLAITTFPFANTYHKLATNPTFSGLAADFPFMTFIMQNLPKIFIALGALFLIILFAKSRSNYASL